MDRAAKSAPEHERLTGSVAPYTATEEGNLVNPLGKARFVHQTSSCIKTAVIHIGDIYGVLLQSKKKEYGSTYMEVWRYILQDVKYRRDASWCQTSKRTPRWSQDMRNVSERV